MKHEPVYRILDAAADRGREAVRVIEDAARFLADSSSMTEQLKAFRHRFAELTDSLPWSKRLASRETESDVGTAIEGAGEYRRESLDRILAANFCRLQESLRSLEEYGKMAVPEIARGMEQLRYQSYTLQKEMYTLFIHRDRRERLTAARLYVLIETSISDEDLAAVALAGCGVFQLRDKTASDRVLYEKGKRQIACLDRLVKEKALPRRPLYIVNDRADIALAIGADGLHIGQSELPPNEARKLIGPDLILGLSTSSAAEAESALADIDGPARVDYIGAGPVFPSTTKRFDSFPGLDYLRHLAKRRYPVPVYAIGGITPENLPEVQKTGIDKICVANAVTGRSDMGHAARKLAAQLEIPQIEES